MKIPRLAQVAAIPAALLVLIAGCASPNAATPAATGTAAAHNDADTTFAQMMVKDHTATSAKLKDVLAQNNIALTPPAALDARRKGMIDNLNAASAEDFDEVYLDQQVAAHQEALSFMRSYADDGENAALKKLAADTAPKIQQHLDEARRLDENDVDDPQ